MKTKGLLIVMVTSLLVMISVSSYSQGFGLGARFGITISKLSNWSKILSDASGSNSTITDPSKIGIQGSFVLNPMFGKIMGMEIELNFEQKGYKWKSDNSGAGSIDIEYRGTYNYLTLPILVKGGYAFGMFSVYGFFGPYVSFAIGATEKYYEKGNLKETNKVEFGSGEWSGNNGTASSPRKGPYYQYKAMLLDAGLTLGLQPGVRLGPGDLVLDIRYSWGLLGVDHPTAGNKTDYNDYADTHDMLAYYPLCNRSFGLSVGYILRFGQSDKK